MRYLSRAGWFLVLVCWCSLACVAPASAADRIYYYHNDHLGTPVAMTDESGQVVWRADYEPFGAATVTVSGPPPRPSLPSDNKTPSATAQAAAAAPSPWGFRQRRT